MATIKSIALSIGGTLGTKEIWTVNPFYQAPIADGYQNWEYEDAVERAQAVADISLPGTLRALLSTAGTRDRVKLQAYDTSDALAFSVPVFSSALQTGTGGPSKALQDSLVISLRTQAPGPSGRGRLYWPALGASLSSTGFELTTPNQTDVLDDAKTYLKAVRDALRGTSVGDFGYELGVRSRKQGVTHFVSRLQVGSVLDTQRRRRDATPDVYVSTPYPV